MIAARFKSMIVVALTAGMSLLAFARQPTRPATQDADQSAQPASGPTSTPTPSTQASIDPHDAAALRAAYLKPSDQWPAATWDESIAADDRHELALVPKVPFPAENPFTPEKAQLGRRLFFDPRLSGSAFIACVSCHHPDVGWSDGKTTSQGHQLQPLSRNAPTLMGVGFAKHLMWDGAAASLEDQALLPLANAKEMHGEFGDTEKSLNEISEYRAEFKAVFGKEQITINLIAKALATFQRTIVPGRSRFDFFLRGRADAMSDAEVRGLHLFRTKARCINCHGGPLMMDDQFHNIGLTYYGRKYQDLGRYEETRDVNDVGAFKTPTLRNLNRTGPYMHNGFFELQGVINLYNVGMPTEKVVPGDPLSPHKSTLLKRLNLTREERSDLIDFLRDALEEPRAFRVVPKLPGLYGEDPIPRGATSRPTTEEADEQ